MFDAGEGLEATVELADAFGCRCHKKAVFVFWAKYTYYCMTHSNVATTTGCGRYPQVVAFGPAK